MRHKFLTQQNRFVVVKCLTSCIINDPFKGIFPVKYVLFMYLCLIANDTLWGQSESDTLKIPFLAQQVEIDGDLGEWKAFAHHDGTWDIFRVAQSSWYEPSRNRLTDHGDEPAPEKDLMARYYIAWDSSWLYLGAEVVDNVNDIIPHKPEARRWYYKDCVAWFIEGPADTINESFGQGDNAFCFVIDPSKPENGAWWRHGSPDTSYLEEPIPSSVRDYEIRMRGDGNFILEARVRLASTFGVSDPNWQTPGIGDLYRLMIVHTDPDGGDYGGHLLIYGKGDNDATWTPAVLSPPRTPILRKNK